MNAQNPNGVDLPGRTLLHQNHRIDNERVHLLFRQSPWSIAASLISGLLLVFLLRDLIDHGRLAAWMALIVLTAAIRCVLLLNFKRLAPSAAQLPAWRNYNVITLLISGLIWGSLPTFLFPLQSPAHQFYIATVVCGMVAGAAMAFAAVMRAFLAYSVPALVPLAFRFWSIPGELHATMAFLTLLYLLFSFMIAGNLRRTRIELLALKDELSERVQRRTRALEESNRKLQTEIEERARMQERLIQERDRLEIITAGIGVGLALISTEYQITWANQVLKKMFGEVEGKTCREIYRQSAGIGTECNSRQVFEGQQEVVRELKGLDHSGNPAWWQIITTPIRDAHGRVSAAIEMVIPTTQLKLAEQERLRMANQLEAARKFEAVATLAGGIAHQFNNALAVIFGNMELLDHKVGVNAGAHKHIAPILASATRMSHLTDQLLAYAKGGNYKAHWTDMRLFVQDTLEIAEHSLRSGIELRSEIAPGLPEVKMDVTQMQMVVSAILSNAAEAIENEGLIRLTCRRVVLDAHAAGSLEGLQPGLHAELRIIDTGSGMDEATLARIFEPFFSTKFQGRGLAMAAVFGIVKSHRGHIQVESAPGRGTVVTLYLPAREPALQEEPPAAAYSGGATILLIEDEAMVREVNRALLERLGHTVIEAATGRQARDAVAARAFDLVMLDIQLPDMGGADLFHFIKAQRPESKVIVCSGYVLDNPAPESIEAKADAYLPKPFSIGELEARIKAVLQRKEQ